MKPIPYGKQEIIEEDISAVVEILRSDFLTQGPKIAEFEEKFAQYVGAKYAVALANGTAALHLSVLVLGIEKGQKVITTPITFVASANCILYAGGVPDFVDVDPQTITMDLEELEKKLSSSKKGEYAGIIPVDFAGYPVNMERVRSIANQYGVWVLEDACHAPGGYFLNSKGERVPCGCGKYADLAIFSFHPVKHIATGEGGMITTNKKDLYEKLLLIRTHGITKDPIRMTENHGGWYYEMQELGYNYRLSDIQASLGISQLNRAKKLLERRREIARKYDTAFSSSQVQGKVFPIHNANHTYGHAYHLYVVRTKERNHIYNTLRDKNIFTQVHYIPIHLQPYYRKMGFKEGNFPNAENYYKEALSLPMYPSLKDEDVDRVIEEIYQVCKTL